jgi:hypothetical protein
VVRAGGDAATRLVHRNVRLVMPTEYRTPALSALHARGLFSTSKLGRWRRRRVSTGRGMARRRAARSIDGCDECRKAAHVSRTSEQLWRQRERARAPTSACSPRARATRSIRWQVPRARFNKRWWRSTCLFTGFTLLLPVEDGSAAESARAVDGRVLEVLGTPRFVKTDGGPEFGGAFVECMREFGVRLVRGTPYNSDGQARVERKIGEVNAIRAASGHARAAVGLAERCCDRAAGAVGTERGAAAQGRA